MKKEAEANAEADSKAKETTDKINAADGMIFQTEKQLKEYHILNDVLCVNVDNDFSNNFNVLFKVDIVNVAVWIANLLHHNNIVLHIL